MDDEVYNGDMQPPSRPTPEEALDWVRKMMAVYTPEQARELSKLTQDHEQVIMGGWDRRQRKYFPGLLVTIANMNRWIAVLFAMAVVTMLGTSAPSWWPMLRSLWP